MQARLGPLHGRRLIARRGLAWRRRILGGHKEWVGEAKSRGNPENCGGQKEDFAESERMEAD